jgi:xylulokinase
MTVEYYISLDLGTTAIKTVLFDNHGRIISASRNEYELYTPVAEIVEFKCESYWQLCLAGIREVLTQSKVSVEKIKSIGICSQGETLIALDKTGQPIRNAIVWMDNRSGKEADEIANVLGKGECTGQLGCNASWPITKILWLKRNEPKTYNNAGKFMLLEDYILYLLTGKYVGEFSMYSSSFMLDIYRKEWWQAILDYVGVSEERLVELKEPGEVIGRLQISVCGRTGLKPETLVITGTMDQTAAVVGSGGINNDVITETTGAALAVCATVDKRPETEKLPIPIQYHAIANKYLLIGWCPTAGMAFKWFRDTFFESEKETALCERQDCYEFMTNLAKNISPGCDRLIFLPYLAGAGAADLNNWTAGVFHGIGLHHKRGHFVRSIMESIGFILRENIEMMSRLGVECKEIHSLGGGAKSTLWNQIKSNITNRPVVTMKCSESAALGTAIIQAVALGRYESYEEACRNMLQINEIIKPDREMVQKYHLFYNRFLETRSACCSVY